MFGVRANKYALHHTVLFGFRGNLSHTSPSSPTSSENFDPINFWITPEPGRCTLGGVQGVVTGHANAAVTHDGLLMMLPESAWDRVLAVNLKGAYLCCRAALRAAVDMTLIGERTITIDCDMLQADGGTRTAAIKVAMSHWYWLCSGLWSAAILSDRLARVWKPRRQSPREIERSLLTNCPVFGRQAPLSKAHLDRSYAF